MTAARDRTGTVVPPAYARGPVPARGLARVVEVAAWLALVAFVVGSVGASLVGARVFLGADALETFLPWRALDPAPESVTNSWVGDTIDVVVPRTMYVAEAMRDGDLAQWNPYTAGGSPSAPLPDNAPFSPLTLPWYVLAPALAPGVVKVLEIVTVALGMVLLGRRLGLPRAAGALATLVYASSGFMIAWTNWTQTRVAAFVPLLFWAVDRAVVERRPRDVVPVALVVAAMIAGGFPAVAGWALYFAGAYAVVRALALRPGPRAVLRAAAVAGAGVVAGALLMAWQLVPFVQQTLGVVDLEARDESPANHLEWTTLATAVVPDILGGPGGERWGTRHNPIENFSYVGAAAVLLGLVGLVAWRARPGRPAVKGFMFGALGVSMLLVYVGGAPLGLAQTLPVFENNMIGRMRVMVGFFAALCAAFGFAAVLDRWAGGPPVGGAAADDDGPTPPDVRAERSRPGRGWRALLLVVCGVTALAAVAAVARVLTFVPPEHRDALGRASVVAGVLAAVTLALVLLARRRLWGVVAFGVLVPGLVAAPAVGVARTWWPQADPDLFYPETSAHRFLEENLGDDRFISVDQTMLPGSSSVYALRAADGHAFHAPQWRDLLDEVDPEVGWGNGQTYTSLRSADLAHKLESGVLDRIGVRYVTVPPGLLLPGSLEPVAPASGSLTLTAGVRDAPPTRTTGPLRGVVLDFPSGIASGPGGVVVAVDVTSPDGTPVTSAERSLEVPLAPGQLWIAVAGEGLDAGEQVDVAVEVRGDVDEVELGAAASGGAALTVLRPAADDLDVVDTGGVTVLERRTALSRLRWAGEERVEPDPQARLALMAAGEVPADAVVLQDPDDARDVSGSTGDLDVERDSGDTIEVAVQADGDGWLVVADALQGSEGWRATVDGRATPIVPAEHAGGAVLVPAGDHEVRLTYTMPGVVPGAVVGGATALVLLVLGVAGGRGAARLRRR